MSKELSSTLITPEIAGNKKEISISDLKPDSPEKFIARFLNSRNPIEAIKFIIKNYPEMQWLTKDTNATPEMEIGNDKKITLGEQIYPNFKKDNLTEFNRTAVGILVLQWILQNDYENFTACQNNSEKLSPESFEQLRQYVKKIVPNNEAADAMITYMVINDLTKIKSVVAKIQQKSGIQDVNHDKLLLIALRDYPEISPSFQRLSPKYQELILNGLSAEFNMGQYIFQENFPADLTGLKKLSQNELNFYMIHFLCDVDGVLGHLKQDGSAILTEDYWKIFNLAQNSLSELSKGKTEKEANEIYLDSFGKLIEIDNNNKTSTAIKKLCCMLKIYNKDGAQTFLRVFNNLPENIKNILVRELNKNGIDDGFAIRIYYAPALVRTMMSHKKTTEGLIVLAHIYQKARVALKNRKGNGVYTVMASSVAKMASRNPQNLEKYKIKLNNIGNDAEVKLIPFSNKN